MYGRWFTTKYGEERVRREFVKLHALVTADTDMPFFVSATVTDGLASDPKQLPPLLDGARAAAVVDGIAIGIEEACLFGQGVSVKVERAADSGYGGGAVHSEVRLGGAG